MSFTHIQSYERSLQRRLALRYTWTDERSCNRIWFVIFFIGLYKMLLEQLVKRSTIMKEALIAIIFLTLGCAGGSYSSKESKGFDMSICNDIPLSVEAYEAMDPETKAQKISCADLEKCSAIMGQAAPPDVPCE
jgi:hypothetical protein